MSTIILNDVKPSRRNIINKAYNLYDSDAFKVSTQTDYEANTKVELVDKPVISGFKSELGPREKNESSGLQLQHLEIKKVKLTDRTPHKTLNDDGTDRNEVNDQPTLNKVLIKLMNITEKNTKIDSQFDPVPNVKKSILKY
jgi:hypothetical protein